MTLSQLLKTTYLIFTFFVIFSCNNNPCSDVICSSNASCQDGTCLCDDGYELDANGNCVIPDPCQNITCSVNSTCVNGNCVCDDGYTSNGAGGCVELRAQFIRNYNLSEQCTSGPDSYNAAIAADNAGGIRDIIITGLYNSSRSVRASLTDDDKFTIASQSFGVGTLAGQGNMINGTLTISYTFTDAAGNSDSCTATLSPF